MTERRLLGDHISSGKVVSMFTEVAGKISHTQYAPQLQGLWDWGIYTVFQYRLSINTQLNKLGNWDIEHY